MWFTFIEELGRNRQGVGRGGGQKLTKIIQGHAEVPCPKITRTWVDPGARSCLCPPYSAPAPQAKILLSISCDLMSLDISTSKPSKNSLNPDKNAEFSKFPPRKVTK